MKNLHNELDQLQKSLRIQFLLFIGVIILAVAGSVFSYQVGYMDHSIEVADRAKEVATGEDCYTLQDIEIVPFGEPQL